MKSQWDGLPNFSKRTSLGSVSTAFVGHMLTVFLGLGAHNQLLSGHNGNAGT